MKRSRRPKTHDATAAKKRFGQHFLTDPNTARIVAAGVTPEDIVLEIGPGRGFLTKFLAATAKTVHAIEIDTDVMPHLRESIADHGNILVHEADALNLDFSTLHPPPTKLVANLPYNVASPLVIKVLEELPTVTICRFMVQLEVARRMAAKRGTKDYAGYAVLIQMLTEPKIVHKVPPTVFDPPPRVQSAVVQLERRGTELIEEEYRGVKELVLAAFSSRRKRLANNLLDVEKSRAFGALTRVGLPEDSRAEELSPGDFVELYREFRRG